jgi:RHS repeat-associated protein
VGGVLAVNIATNGIHFAAYDGNGNVSALVSAASGAITAKYEYSPYGETLRANGVVAKANPIRFSTQFVDEITRRLKYLHREYEPPTGRWLSRDPIGERGGKNLYGFVRNSTPNRVDVLGLSGRGGPIVKPAVGDVGTISDFDTTLGQIDQTLQSLVDLDPTYPGVDYVQRFRDQFAGLLNSMKKIGPCDCRAYVVCRPLGLKPTPGDPVKIAIGPKGTAAGLFTGFRAKHCFILLADRCAADQNVPKTTVITLGAKPAGDYLTAQNRAAEFHEVGSGCGTCNKLKDLAPKYNSPPYDKDGPNSNTFISELIKATGLPDPFAGWLNPDPWGWSWENPNPVWRQ